MNWIISLLQAHKEDASPPPRGGGTHGQRDHGDLGGKAVDPVGLVLVMHVPLIFYSKTHKFIFSMLSFTPLISRAPLLCKAPAFRLKLFCHFPPTIHGGSAQPFSISQPCSLACLLCRVMLLLEPNRMGLLSARGNRKFIFINSAHYK